MGLIYILAEMLTPIRFEQGLIVPLTNWKGNDHAR
jgi:hypothetical protein